MNIGKCLSQACNFYDKRVTLQTYTHTRVKVVNLQI